MASPEIRPELDELLRDVAGSFTPDSLKQVIQSTKKTLGGKFESLPDDDLYPLLRRLRREGHITDDNVTMLDKVFASQTTKQEAITEKINLYKGLGFHKKGLVVEATGRTEEISEILRRLSSDEIHMVNVYGSGGVGKTTVAKQIHSQWRGKHFMVDLREVTSMGVLHFKVLQIFKPSTTTISYEAKPVMDRIQHVVEGAKEPVLLTLDNVEQFITEKNGLKVHFVGFLRRLSEVKGLKVLLTSRCEVGDTKVVNDFCLEPLQSDSSQELLQSMAEVHLDVNKRERLVKHCRGKPLFLKGMASVLRQEIEKAEDLLSRIEKEAGEKLEESTKPEGQEPTKAQEGSKEEIEPEDLIVLKEMFSKISSQELKDAAVAISLFRLPFTASSAAAVLDVPIEKAFLLLESLRNNGIINLSDPDAKKLLYDIHPLMLSFVSSIKNEPEFKEKYGVAEKRFCTIFIKKMTYLSSMLDAKYLTVHKQFQAERANFELVLEISLRESNYVHQLFSRQYHEDSMLCFLLEAMLPNPELRKMFFHSWAESVDADHEGILSANLRCWEAFSTLNSEGIHRAFRVLKKAKSSLGKVKQEERGSKEYQLTQSLYLFVEGEMYLKRGQPRVALEKLINSLETRKKLLGAHGETAKCFSSIGNCFCELDKLNDALEYYKKAYEMREKLTGSENHFEMPIYKNQMGGVEERMKNYVKAIEIYENALELEKKLKFMTYANTAVFKRNIANAYMWKGDYNKALKPAKEAYQIRRELLGNNPDTVRSAYQMGLIYREREDQMRALKFLREAWEMEKGLERGNHSPVRDRIPTDILYCLRKEEKAAFKADMLEFYRRIWEEEKSFEAFQPSPPNQAIIDKIMQLVSDRQANEDVDLREKYEEEALWYYENAWGAEVGFFRELKPEDRPEKQQEMVFKRDQILDRILYLCGELGKEEESKKCEEVQKKFKYKLLKTEEFRGYGRYSREELQQALGDESLPIPAEIIARGAEAEKAYRKVLKEGMVQVYRARIMLVGQDRAGKTSLKKSLLGMPFNPEQPSTVGIEVDPSRMEVEVGEVKNWQRLDEKKSGLSAVYADDIAKDMAEVLKEALGNMDVPSPSDFAGLDIEDIHISRNEKDHEGEDSGSMSSASEEHEDEEAPVDTVPPPHQGIIVNEAFPEMIQVARKSSDELPVAEITEESKRLRIDTSLGEDVRGPLIQYLKNLHVEKDTKNKETVMSIWDFAGQQLYYASHSVFLSPRAIYVLVYDLSKDLNAKAEPCARQGVHKIRFENPNDETNLDNLLSWLVSIHSSRPVDSEGRTEYVRPPVLIVGTHADKTSTKKQEDAEACIKKSISGEREEKSKPIGEHVIRSFFKVDNTASCKDEGVGKLQKEICKILKVEPYMGEYVPTKWFNFEKIIQALIGIGRHHLTVEELAEIARKVCFIDDAKELNEMLEFYHSLGEIMKHEGTVVLQTTWLIDLFRKLITVSPFDEQIPKYTGCWNDLEENGILRMELVDHVLGETSMEDVQKEDLLNMMEKFGLVAKFFEMKETDTGIDRSEGNQEVHYFIPSQLRSSPKELVNVEPEKDDPCPIYLRFEDEFVPHGLFPQIVSRLIRWCSDLGYGPPPKLYHCGSRFFGVGKPNSPHDLILIAKKQYIKVVLRRDEGCDTGSNVAADVRDFLENTLDGLKRDRASLRCMSHQWCVRCPPCLAKSEDFHLLPVKPNEKLHCTENFDKKRISLDGLEFWFPRNPFLLAHTVQDGLPACAEIKRGKPSLRELDDLSTDIYPCWKRLGYQLGLEAEIDCIAVNNVQFPGPQEKAFKMLTLWRDKEASSTYEQLSEALKHIGQGRLAEEHCH